MSSSLTPKQIQHLYWRAGFGITPKQLKQLRKLNRNQQVDLLFKESSAPNDLKLSLEAVFKKELHKLSLEEKQHVMKLRNKKMEELNLVWITRMNTTNAVLHEKMTLFFHNHFAVRLNQPFEMLSFHNMIRKNALGNFGEMLMDVSKTPAMIKFLNNRQNKKGSPNENFAREVMELFTLGRDNGYTQDDIKEAARAFTGWDFDADFNFQHKHRKHDDGEKTILGRTGYFKGEDVIKLLLEQKQTAKYVVEKLYKYLVNDTLNQTTVDRLTNTFYNSNYDMKILLREIFTSDWFYNKENVGVKIKSPIEFLIGINRQFNIIYEKPKNLMFIQRGLKQVVFYPPNVAGWPGGKHWIDSATLLLRMRLPSVLLGDGTIDFDVESEGMMKQKRGRFFEKKIVTNVQWKKYLKHFSYDTLDAIVSFFIQPKIADSAKESLSNVSNASKENFITAVLSLPEYQLC